jgi:uncharacterized protein
VRSVLTFVIVSLIVLALAFLFAEHQKRTGMFFPAKYPLGDWHRPDAEDIEFDTPDGERLHGWLFRADDPNAPLMIWFHGNAGNVTVRGDVAAEFARRGVTVFVFDWRGFGRSSGSPGEHPLKIDSIAAYDEMMRTVGPTAAIAFYGESVGGPYAAWTAMHRQADAVILENSFPSLAALANSIYRPIPLGLLVPRSLRTVDWLNDAGVPVLVMHGRRDGVIPFRLGLQLYERLQTRKEFFESETAGHSQLPEAEGDRFFEAVVNFIRSESGRVADQ